MISNVIINAIESWKVRNHKCTTIIMITITKNTLTIDIIEWESWKLQVHQNYHHHHHHHSYIMSQNQNH